MICPMCFKQIERQPNVCIDCHKTAMNERANAIAEKYRLQSERDRYREALEEVRDKIEQNLSGELDRYLILAIAATALREGEEKT